MGRGRYHHRDGGHGVTASDEYCSYYHLAMLSIWFYLTSLCVGTALSIACFVCVAVVLERAREACNMLERVDSDRVYAFERRVGEQLWLGMTWRLRRQLGRPERTVEIEHARERE